MTYFNIDIRSRPVTTASADCQLWVDRGMTWCWAYHHEEAVACFRRAIEFDSACAMAHWGLAYALGPNYNFEWRHHDPAGLAVATAATHAAMTDAFARIDGTALWERALIEALRTRYQSAEPVEDQAAWNIDFADAMRAVHAAHPDDIDIAAVLAEAILNLTPWKMWDIAKGVPAPDAATEEARALLERMMAEHPEGMAHPGILHLYVHLMEMSPEPEAALRAGDVLRRLVPDAGHLIHMPTHLDVLCGDYQAVLEWNLRGGAADDKLLADSDGLNIYTLYRNHNFDFAVYGAMFLGRFAPAMAAAEGLIARTPPGILRIESPPMADFVEPYLNIRLHVLIRFGRWEEILEDPLPEDPALYCVTTATARYARTLAFAALDRVAEAEAEEALFQAARAAVPDTRFKHNVRSIDKLCVADAMLRGEIAYRKGDFDTAFAALREAVALDDALPYDEPWGWMQPTRHALGALLLEQGHLAEAAEIYREDLGLAGTLPRAQVHPDNIWSLTGLDTCLVRMGSEGDEHRLIRQRLDLARARADDPPKVSCLCARG